MIREARSNQRVLRLHAGDAFVFGRGGEEGDALDAAGVKWEIVPGVSAAIAAPASAKIPLTHRGEARGFSVRTGHTLSGYSNAELPKSEETLVILMGLGAARQIMDGLIAEGYPPDLPAAAVSNATRANQRVVKATIATLADEIEQEQLEAPATLIVGKVVHRAKAETLLGSDEAAA
jgi:siroheme synthase